MRGISGRASIMAGGTVVLLFAVVWALAVSNLGLTLSFLAAALVAATVAFCIYALRQSSPPRDDGVVRLQELIRRPVAENRGIRDDATGLLNRWYLERRLDEEAARCDRYAHQMAVVVLKAIGVDLASFSIDGWQEQSSEAARRCAGVIRNVDLSAALAPFEFAMCLVHCDRAGAEAAIECIISEFTDYDCRVGIAVYPDEDCEPQALIELAQGRARAAEAA